ncbi:MAG TPA: HAMP domain-containing sensor histidine kinase [Vicinamibacterales bacterium]|nr:HAMP domain-containing sensor histidine kinase [Vicinamibacterales bacterium]
MTLALSAGFVWLGWRLVAQERTLARHRLQERLGHTADVVTLGLEGAIERVDRLLERLASGQPPSEDDLAGATFVVVDRAGVRAWPAQNLAYYPVAPEAASTAADLSAGTLLQEAALLRSAGRHDAALSVYDRLIAANATVLGAPADVVGRHARCRVLADLGRRESLAAEARALAAALRRRPWDLTPGVYSFYARDARQWLAAAPDAAALADVHRAEARAAIVTTLSLEWWAGSADPTARVVRVVRAEDEPLTVIARRVEEQIAMFVGDAEFLAAALGGIQRTASDSAAADVALVADGRLAAGRLPAAGRERIERSSDETGLPWTIYVGPGADLPSEPVAAERGRLLLSAIALVGVCAIVATVATARAVHRELEMARLQADFVAAVSHEFRTPLAAVSQLAELLADNRIAGDDQRQEYYARLQRESARLRRLVEDLLDFRRMEAGAHEYRRELADPGTLVRDAVETMTVDAATRARITVDVAGDLPAVHADAEAIARAIRNLADNAIKYGLPGGRVRIAAARTATGVGISVRDDGPGIPPGHQRAIFEKFVRGPGAAGPGTGLGLAMVRQIAGAHGGSIELDSEPGSGSTFTIHLPSA